MVKQLMIFSIICDDIIVESGKVTGEGSTVFEMTENVANKLAAQFNIEQVEFIDVSDSWTFEGEKNHTVFKIEFSPVDTPADKFGIDAEVN